MHLLTSWGVYAVGLLYLWLAAAYLLSAKRSGQRHWWMAGLSWGIWIALLPNISLFERNQFRTFPVIMSAVLFVMPLVTIMFHLLGKGRFTGYSHPRDVLLFRRPHLPSRRSPSAIWESLAISALALTFVLLSAASLSLRPCHWLDRTLSISGCEQILLYDGLLKDLAFSPDGTLLAIAADEGVRMWNAMDGQLLMTIPYTDGAESVAFSADGQLLASGGREQHIQVRQISGAMIRQLPTTDYAESIAFSSDGRLIGAGVGDSVVVWRVDDGSQLWTLAMPDEVNSVVFSPDGQFLAAGAYDGAITVWRSVDGTPIQTLTGSTVYRLAFSSNSATLASGISGDRIDLWHITDGRRMWSFTGPATHELEAMWSVAFSPDGAYLFGGSGDRTVRIWRTTDLTPLTTLTFGDQVHNLAVHPNNRTFAIGLWDGTIRLWRVPQ